MPDPGDFVATLASVREPPAAGAGSEQADPPHAAPTQHAHVHHDKDHADTSTTPGAPATTGIQLPVEAAGAAAGAHASAKATAAESGHHRADSGSIDRVGMDAQAASPGAGARSAAPEPEPTNLPATAAATGNPAGAKDAHGSAAARALDASARVPTPSAAPHAMHATGDVAEPGDAPAVTGNDEPGGSGTQPAGTAPPAGGAQAGRATRSAAASPPNHAPGQTAPPASPTRAAGAGGAIRGSGDANVSGGTPPSAAQHAAGNTPGPGRGPQPQSAPVAPGGSLLFGHMAPAESAALGAAAATAAPGAAPSGTFPNVVALAVASALPSPGAVPAAASPMPQAAAAGSAPPATTLDIGGTLVGQPGWAQSVAHAIVAHAGAAGGVLRLRVRPPELGPVDIALGIHNANAGIQIVAQHPLTQAALQQSIPQLQTLLGQHGVQLVHVDVTADQSGGRGQRQDAPPTPARVDAPTPNRLRPVAGPPRPRTGLVDDYA